MYSAQPAPPGPPAGGAEFYEILIAFGMALAVGLPVAWFIWRELAGKPTVIARFADWLAAKDGTPRWVALPTYLLIPSLLLAGWGVWWDVPIHMQDGRDEGPLANPSHYPIYFAILAFFALGVISATLAYQQPLPRRSFKIIGQWRAPMGSMILIAAGAIAVVGFPADDLWHRLFGQDVTEWGPTHVMMIGGAVTSVLALPLLRAEAAQIGAVRNRGLSYKLWQTILVGLCIVPFAFLMEFDLGVPQFPAATQFIIAGFLVGWIFVAARRFFGPGGALIAWGVYAVAHAFLYVTIAILPDDTMTARFLLFLPAAVLVELVALVLKPRSGYAFGLVAGFLAGSLGMLAEWGWSIVFMPLPQPLPASSLPLMISVGTVAGIAGGLLGVWHYRQLERVGGNHDDAVTFNGIERTLRAARLGVAVGVARPVFNLWYREMLKRTPAATETPVESGFGRRHAAGLAGMTIFILLMGYFAPPAHQEGVTGTVELSNECDGMEFGCFTDVTITFDQADIADDAVWFYALAYQGRRGHEPGQAPGGGVLSYDMVPTGTPGQFRSERPLPMYGQFKTALRLHKAPTTLIAAFLYAPEDREIPGDKGDLVLAESGEQVEFWYEPEWLQRERKEGVPEWLWTAAYATVGAAWLGLLAFYGWCYGQAAYGADRRSKRRAAHSSRPADPNESRL